MSKYLLMRGGIVHEIIPGEDPIFPGIPIGERFAPDFIAQLEEFPDDTAVEVGWTKTEDGFAPPPPTPEPEPIFPPDPPAPEPTYAERVVALEDAMLALIMGGA